MGGDLDHSDFVDPDFDSGRRLVASTPTSAIGVTGASAVAGSAAALGGARPPSREEINEQVTAAQKALVELKRRQEELERERTQLEEARRRRLEYEQGREEMLSHLTRGIGLLTESEQASRRDAEQMSRTLTDLRTALDKVSALHEETWSAESYSTELTRALTTLEHARMEWNSAQLKWPLLARSALENAGGGEEGLADPRARLLDGKTPAELARMGLALTWPVALAVLVVGVLLALVLGKR